MRFPRRNVKIVGSQIIGRIAEFAQASLPIYKEVTPRDFAGDVDPGRSFWRLLPGKTQGSPRRSSKASPKSPQGVPKASRKLSKGRPEFAQGSPRDRPRVAQRFPKCPNGVPMVYRRYPSDVPEGVQKVSQRCPKGRPTVSQTDLLVLVFFCVDSHLRAPRRPHLLG